MSRRSPLRYAVQQPHAPPCNSAQSASRARASAAVKRRRRQHASPRDEGHRKVWRRATEKSNVVLASAVPLSRCRRPRAAPAVAAPFIPPP
eukprot:scaffold45980_cov39-Phaeocystis_antarctica.AAC.1